jgi:hypothetical protein
MPQYRVEFAQSEFYLAAQHKNTDIQPEADFHVEIRSVCVQRVPLLVVAQLTAGM